jgi:hypothetical protein
MGGILRVGCDRSGCLIVGIIWKGGQRVTIEELTADLKVIGECIGSVRFAQAVARPRPAIQDQVLGST